MLKITRYHRIHEYKVYITKSVRILKELESIKDSEALDYKDDIGKTAKSEHAKVFEKLDLETPKPERDGKYKEYEFDLPRTYVQNI